MDIPPDSRPPDPIARRRQLDLASGVGARKPGDKADANDVSATPDSFAAPDTQTVARYTTLAQARSTDPAKLAALRQAIDDGSYTATPEELVDPLLDRLDPPRQG